MVARSWLSRIKITKELCTLIVFLCTSIQVVLNLEVDGFLPKFIPHVFFMTSTLGLDTIFVVLVQYQAHLGVDKLGIAVLVFAISHTIPPIFMAIYGSGQLLMCIHIAWCSSVHAIHYYHIHRFCQLRDLRTPKQYTLVILEVLELAVNATMWSQRWFPIFSSVAMVAALAHNSQQYMTKKAVSTSRRRVPLHSTSKRETQGDSSHGNHFSGGRRARDKLPVMTESISSDKHDSYA